MDLDQPGLPLARAGARLSRRELLKRSAGLAGALALGPALLTAATAAPVSRVRAAPLPQAGDPSVLPTEEEVRAAIPPSARNLPDKGKTLQLLMQAGGDSIVVEQYRKIWQEETGIGVEFETVPPQSMLEKMGTVLASGSDAYDLLEIQPAWVGGFAEPGFLLNLDEYYKKYESELDLSDYIEGAQVGFNTWKGSWVAIPFDGDVLIFYYRKDLFGDSQHQAEFKAKYGYDLTPPETWDQVADQAEFFDGRVEGIKGFGTVANRWWGSVTYWASVYRTYIPHQVQNGLVNDNNEIELDHDAFLKGEAMWEKLISHAPEGVLGWGYSECKEALAGGQVAMALQWATSVFLDPRQGPSTYDKLDFVVMPGTRMADGSIKKAPSLAVGKTLVIPRNAPKKDAAFLFGHFLSSKAMQIAATNLGTGVDPNRYSVFEDPRVQKVWGPMIPVFRESLKLGVPDIKVAASAKYYEVATTELTSTWAKQQDAETAYNNIMSQWKEIQASG